MAKSVLETIIKVVKQGGGDKETIKGLADTKKSISDVMSIMGGFVAVGAAVNTAFKNTAGVFVDYAAKVRDLARVTGMGAEQTSRLIQVADDAKVSYESLQKALWFAAKNGVEPNIDTISRLADEYVALADPTKQAELLTKNFGKGGAEMAKLLELGSAGVQKLNDSISKNLVLTESATLSARLWEIQQDQFNDTIEGTKVAIGQDLIGILTGATGEINKLALANYKAATGIETTGRAMSHLKDGENEAWDAARKMAEQQWVLANSTDTTAQSTVFLSEAARDSANAMTQNAQSMEQAAEEAALLADRQKEVMDVAFQLQSALDSYNDTMSNVNAKQAEATATWEDAQRQYEQHLITSKQLAQAEMDYNAAMAQTAEEATRASEIHQAAMNKIVFGIIQAQAASDGLTASESKGLLQVAVRLGMVDQATADLANDMVNNFTQIGDGVREQGIGPVYKFNEQVWVAKNAQGTYKYNFLINTVGSVPDFSTASGGQKSKGKGGSKVDAEFASGGQWGGQWATVGEEGMELISPSGYIFPADVTKHMLAAGLVPGREFAGGGSLGVSAAENLRRGRTMPKRTKSGSVITNGSMTASVGTTITTEAVIEASQQMADVSTANMQANAKTQNEMQSAQTATVSAIETANADLINEIKMLNQNIEKLQEATTRGIRESIQMAVA